MSILILEKKHGTNNCPSVYFCQLKRKNLGCIDIFDECKKSIFLGQTIQRQWAEEILSMNQNQQRYIWDVNKPCGSKDKQKEIKCGTSERRQDFKTDGNLMGDMENLPIVRDILKKIKFDKNNNNIYFEEEEHTQAEKPYLRLRAIDYTSPF